MQKFSLNISADTKRSALQMFEAATITIVIIGMFIVLGKLGEYFNDFDWTRYFVVVFAMYVFRKELSDIRETSDSN